MNRPYTLLLVLIILCAAGYAGWTLWKNAPTAPSTERAVPIRSPFGTVTEKTDNGFTVVGIGDKTLSVRVTAQTQFLAGTSTKSVADITVGSIVSITSNTKNADGSVTALSVQILPPPPAR